MEDLEKLILFLQNEFKNFYSDWKNDGNYVKFNMKKILLKIYIMMKTYFYMY